MEVEYLFVYGTLLKQYDDKISHSFIERYTEFVGKASTQGKMFMVDYYPGLVESTEKYFAKGELYRIKDADSLFHFLDKHEEYLVDDEVNSEYIRKKTNVQLKTGEVFEAWTYFYNQSTDDLELLPKGDFLNEYHK